MTTVATGQVLLAGTPPAGLAASFAALHVVSLACAGSIDYAGPDNHSRITRLPHCLPPTRHGVGILICDFSKLNHPAHRCLRPTLHETPRDVPCKTRGQDGVAGSFPVGLLHPLQHAGLSRRTVTNRRGTHRTVWTQAFQISWFWADYGQTAPYSLLL